MTTDTLATDQGSKALGATLSLLDGRKQPKILVVDDDHSVRSLLYDVLTETGYNVDTAADGAQGLLLFELAHPDLVILESVLVKSGPADEVVRVFRLLFLMFEAQLKRDEMLAQAAK